MSARFLTHLRSTLSNAAREYNSTLNGPKVPLAIILDPKADLLTSVDNSSWLTLAARMDPLFYRSYYRHRICTSKDRPLLQERLVWHASHQLIFEQTFSAASRKQLLSNPIHLEYAMLNYLIYLQLVPLVPPTPMEDFLWHSHLFDHDNYVLQTGHLFGRTVDHKCSFAASHDLRHELYTHLFSILPDADVPVLQTAIQFNLGLVEPTVPIPDTFGYSSLFHPVDRLVE